GSGCLVGTDCVSGVCGFNGLCSAASCSDGLKNGNETDVDCGGACPDCGTGKTCGSNGDCQSQVCTSGRCAAPSCSDFVKNGAETDTDCGGGSCPRCARGHPCGPPT